MERKQTGIAVVTLCFLIFFCVDIVRAECTNDQLFTELSTDPSTPQLNYAAAYGAPITKDSIGSDIHVLEAINLVRQGAAYEIQKTIMYAYELEAVFNPAEYLALTQIKFQALSTLLSSVQVDVSSQNIRDILFGGPSAIFPPNGATKANLIAEVKRQGSRAEVLCGSNRTLAHISLAIRNTQ
jgi:hypothetical protein